MNVNGGRVTRKSITLVLQRCARVQHRGQNAEDIKFARLQMHLFLASLLAFFDRVVRKRNNLGTAQLYRAKKLLEKNSKTSMINGGERKKNVAHRLFRLQTSV